MLVGILVPDMLDVPAMSVDFGRDELLSTVVVIFQS